MSSGWATPTASPSPKRSDMFAHTEAPTGPGSFTSQNHRMLKVDQLFLADQADEVFLVHLENESVTIGGNHVLAFESSLTWDIKRVEGAQAAVMWSTSLHAGIKKTARASALVGRGSGEAFQLALSGQGFVVVQASEGHPIPGGG